MDLWCLHLSRINLVGKQVVTEFLEGGEGSKNGRCALAETGRIHFSK